MRPVENIEEVKDEAISETTLDIIDPIRWSKIDAEYFEQAVEIDNRAISMLKKLNEGNKGPLFAF